jgi:iron-sulfur cluster assembly protein
MGITLTERAVAELKEILKSEGKEGAALRVWVAGGGCSGLSYGMAIDDAEPETDNDEVFTQGELKVYVDKLSLHYMEGSTVDFVEDPEDEMRGGFKIDNPNAIGSCGCGSSFQTEDSPGANGSCGSCCSR